MLPFFEEEEMEAQREVTALAQDLLARKWLKARAVCITTLHSHATQLEVSLSLLGLGMTVS